MLRKRNKLRRAGKLTQADELSAKIVAKNQSRILSRANSQDVKKLWSMVNSATNSKHKNSSIFQFDVDADRLNEYYSQISTDPDYDKDSVMFQLNDILCNKNNDFAGNSSTGIFHE